MSATAVCSSIQLPDMFRQRDDVDAVKVCENFTIPGASLDRARLMPCKGIAPGHQWVTLFTVYTLQDVMATPLESLRRYQGCLCIDADDEDGSVLGGA